MSFGIPLSYPELQNNLAIPSMMVGDDLKIFKGARSSVRSIPTSSGVVGPSAQQQFSIPVGGLEYIKPNSVSLNTKVTITGKLASGQTVGSLLFSGYSTDLAGHCGGASSLINRVNVLMGATSQSYNNYNHMRNSVLPHVIGSEYITKDLREQEFAGVQIDTSNSLTAGSAFSFVLNVSIPLFLPCFNSSQAFPALLMKSPITVDILTESVANAFRSVNNENLTYTLTDSVLVYEAISVSPEFKQALLQSKSGQMYTIKLNNCMSIGPTASQATMNYQIGAGLSSLRAVCWTEFYENRYTFNGLKNYRVFVDNLQISINNPNNSAIAYTELNRALSKLNDYNVTSALLNVNDAAAGNKTAKRSDYTTHKFLGAASCDVFSDYGYASTGINSSTVTLFLEHANASTVADWQVADGHQNTATLYVFLLHDSTLSVDISSGEVMIRN